MADPSSNPSELAVGAPEQYVVIARRYRPQAFGDLIGQEHVAQALSNAIATNRVGHAYLFTGARGVGKTSAARILAKALNCVEGPTATPCNQCDYCQSISGGDDVDVLEIDGASNRGIDEIRQLRQNVNVRPSRSRFKIYIIDEVHMLTREAFNALLKTLEEPPEHVKFVFCTTEPNKIPITILSRCQRFDFAGILTGSIAQRLQQIVQSEQVEAEPEALELLARRAAGSMRDSQSLLEQLLAFAPGKITLSDVHSMLGTAGDERLATLVAHLVDRDAAGALADLDAAAQEGVDLAQLLEQLFGYFRDCMAAVVGCKPDAFLFASPTNQEQVAEAGRQMGLSTVLAVMQILDQTLARMRYSTQGRILAELAVVRICHLENLDELPKMIAQLRSGLPAAGNPQASRVSRAGGDSTAPSVATRPVARKGTPTSPQAADEPPADTVPPPPANRPRVDLTEQNALEIWNLALERMSGIVVDQARQFERVEAAGPSRLVVSLKAGYAFACQRPEVLSRFERALAEVTGQRIQIEFAVAEEQAGAPAAAPRVSPQQRLLEVEGHPMIQKASELFGAQPTRVDDPPKQE